jgi:hypothetical protein
LTVKAARLSSSTRQCSASDTIRDEWFHVYCGWFQTECAFRSAHPSIGLQLSGFGGQLLDRAALPTLSLLSTTSEASGSTSMLISPGTDVLFDHDRCFRRDRFAFESVGQFAAHLGGGETLRRFPAGKGSLCSSRATRPMRARVG